MEQITELENEILTLQNALAKKRELLANLRKNNQKSEEDPKNTIANEEISRYSRQMIIPEIGLSGQLKLKNTSFLIVGAGGLGCPSLIYLVRAGVCKFGIVDYDTVEINNLHRQILYSEECIGTPKVEAAKRATMKIERKCEIETYNEQISCKNAMEIIEKYDIILDCSDNVATRYLLNDACVLAKKPLVSGSALKLEGQLTVYNFNNGPCYRCIFPVPPNPQTVTNCADGGILGAITGVIGSLQALEAIKIALKFEDILCGRLLIFDGSRTIFRNVKLRQKKEDCVICSKTPTITTLIDYEQFCGMKASDKDFALSILEQNERITVEEYLRISENAEKHVLIDVRNEIEFEFCHLNNSKNIPLQTVIENDKDFLNEMKHQIENNDLIIFVCRRGNDSQLAVRHMRKKFENLTQVKDIIGGLHAWHDKINKHFPKY